MLRYPYRDLGTELGRDFRNNLNANFDDVEADVKDLDTRIDNIVAQAGSDNTEIVDARYDSINNVTHPTLKDRLDDTSNKIGILNNELSKQNQQSTTIGHGLNIINASQNSPLDIRIEGRTLVNVSQNVLDPAKYYVLSDKKYKVKFSDGTTYTGVAKFQGKAEKPILIRVSNFENKVSGSTVENPHVAKSTTNTTLQTPNGSWTELNAGYSQISKQDGSLASVSTTTNGSRAQYLFSFNLIEAVERTLGKIPASDTSGKVTWMKNNIAKLACSWWGYGQSPSGYKASLSRWDVVGNTLIFISNHTSSSVARLYGTPNLNNSIDSNGYFHMLAYADPSDGVTASTIYTDYVELEIELKPDAQLWNPRFPLYEVDATEYANILTTWDETEVMRRYPMVESVQHVQNPYVICEGDNLLPPLYEWNSNAQNTDIKAPYEATITTNGWSQGPEIRIKALKNQAYTFSAEKNAILDVFSINSNNVETQLVTSYNGNNIVFTTLSDTVTLRIKIKNGNEFGTYNLKNLMLNLGNQPKPFVPHNPSMLFAEVKLGALSDKKDILWKDGQDWKVTKWIEKSETLTITNNTATLANNAQADTAIIVDESTGEIYKRVVVLSGSGKEFTQGGSGNKTITFNEGYVPTSPKAYYVLATPKTEVVTDKVEGDLVVNGATQISVDSAIIYEKVAFNPTTKQATTSKPSRKVLFVRKGSVNVPFTTYTSNGQILPQLIDAVDTTQDYYVAYQTDKYNFSTNVLAITATYDSSLKSVVDSVVAKQSDLASNQQALIRSVAELYKRVKALGG